MGHLIPTQSVLSNSLLTVIKVTRKRRLIGAGLLAMGLSGLGVPRTATR